MSKIKEQFYTIHEARKQLGVTAQTMRNWDRKGILTPHHRAENGYRYYTQEQIDTLTKRAVTTKRPLMVGYCCSSDADELARQAEYVTSYIAMQGKASVIIKDQCAEARVTCMGIKALLRIIQTKPVSALVLWSSEVVSKTLFDLIAVTAEIQGVDIEVINQTITGEVEDV